MSKKIFVLMCFCLFFCLFVSSSAYSADFENCEVIEVVTMGNQNAHVQLSCIIKQRPVCAVAADYIGFDKSTEEGKIYMSMILTAFATGSKLSGLVDDNQCPAYQNNVALLQHLRMKK